MPKVQLVNPTAPETAVAAPTRGFREIAGARVAVLENAKQHAELLLTEIAEALVAQHGAVRTSTRHKTVSAPADPAVIDALVEEADLVLVGSAD